MGRDLALISTRFERVIQSYWTRETSKIEENNIKDSVDIILLVRSLASHVRGEDL